MHYENINNRYKLVDDEGNGVIIEEVGIMYSQTPGGTVLHAHGNARLLAARCEKVKRDFEACGVGSITSTTKVFRTRTVPASELNQCLADGKYVARMISNALGAERLLSMG